MVDGLSGLESLRGLRTSPQLSAEQQAELQLQLQPLLQRCDWFTIGVMAPSAAAAVQALRAAEQANGWQALELDPAADPDVENTWGPLPLTFFG